MVLETREQFNKYMLDTYSGSESLKTALETPDIKEFESVLFNLIELTLERFDKDLTLSKSLCFFDRIPLSTLGKYFGLDMPDILKPLPRVDMYEVQVGNEIKELSHEQYYDLCGETGDKIVEKVKEKLNEFVGETGLAVVKVSNKYACFYLLTPNRIVLDLLGDLQSQLDHLFQ